MIFHLFVRRLHLYLAMFLMPWFLVYGVSSVPFSHGAYFQRMFEGVPMWSVRFERPYEIAVPAGDDLKPVGARILADAGLEGAFGTYRPNDRELHVFRYDFWRSTRLIYFVDQRRLRAEDRRFRWDQFLTGVHARGGFDQDSRLHDAWGVTVDIVCVGFLLWIASGIYMWWQLRPSRAWGWLALGSGAASFLIFLLAM
jgi:hypothetical protein